VLVAGTAVATARRLRERVDAFADASDRRHWRKIAVRRL
jgi:hypothetical protein